MTEQKLTPHLNTRALFYAVACLVLWLAISNPAFAQSQDLGHTSDIEAISTEIKRSGLENIMISVHSSRGGNGDVAAGYLFALDLVHRFHFQGTITLLAGETQKKILSRLTGKPLNQVNVAKSAARIDVKSIEDLKASDPIQDLFIRLAAEDGEPMTSRHLTQIPMDGKIRLNVLSVVIKQPVLGNTEDPIQNRPHAPVSHGYELDEMPLAGLTKSSAGVYFDPVAFSLRGLSFYETKQRALAVIGKFQNAGLTENLNTMMNGLQEILLGRRLNGATLGFAYGISVASAQKQFEDYLVSLMQQQRDKNEDDRLSRRAITIFTPSGFDISRINSKELKNKIEVIELWRPNAWLALDEKADNAKIYVVKTGPIPHELFTCLLALSEIPAVVAGDGALSAAIALGKPFSMTQVAWNQKNVNDLIENLRILENRPSSRNDSNSGNVQAMSDWALTGIGFVKSLGTQLGLTAEGRRQAKGELALRQLERQNMKGTLNLDYLADSYRRLIDIIPDLSKSILRKTLAARATERARAESIESKIHPDLFDLSLHAYDSSKRKKFVADALTAVEFGHQLALDRFIEVVRVDPEILLILEKLNFKPSRLTESPQYQRVLRMHANGANQKFREAAYLLLSQISAGISAENLMNGFDRNFDEEEVNSRQLCLDLNQAAS